MSRRNPKASSRSWSDVSPPLTPWIIEAVESQGFTKMTPVQASVIPLFCGNKDVVVEAVTGSGKTLAFLIPIIERILRLEENIKPGQTNAVIISPTRELAEQIFNVLQTLLEYCPNDTKKSQRKEIRSQLLIGGDTPTHSDLKKFMARVPHILVGTPGRLLELVKAPSVKLSAVDNMVLDEADRLLDLGFDHSVRTIIGMLPKQKRAGLFSATISEAVGEISRLGLRNPVKIVVKVGSNTSERRIPSSLGISYAITKPAEKIPLLIDSIKTLTYKKAIVYFPTCIGVNYFYSLIKHIMSLEAEDDDELNINNIYSMHGKLVPGARKKTLQNFINSVDQTVLFTTDVAARGLDIPEVDLVIQLDPPADPNVFLHRAGRAGRAGRIGRGIVFLNEGREEGYVDFMAVKKVSMDPFNFEAEKLPDYSSKMRKWILQDRSRHDLAIRSFLSYVRFYAKHTATSIFRVQCLDFVAIAKSYGLLRLPKMPELKAIPEDQLPVKGWLGEVVNMDEYKYLDKKREESRIAELNAPRPTEKLKTKDIVKKSNEAWSGKAERKEIAAERRQKRKIRSDAKILAARGDDSDSDGELQVDWKELVKQKKQKKVENVAAFDDL